MLVDKVFNKRNIILWLTNMIFRTRAMQMTFWYTSYVAMDGKVHALSSCALIMSICILDPIWSNIFNAFHPTCRSLNGMCNVQLLACFWFIKYAFLLLTVYANHKFVRKSKLVALILHLCIWFEHIYSVSNNIWLLLYISIIRRLLLPVYQFIRTCEHSVLMKISNNACHYNFKSISSQFKYN